MQREKGEHLGKNCRGHSGVPRAGGKARGLSQALKRIGSRALDVGAKAPTHKTAIHNASANEAAIIMLRPTKVVDRNATSYKSSIHRAATAKRTGRIGCAINQKL